MSGEKCRSNLITDYRKILGILQSEEVIAYIPNMFPVSDYLAALTNDDRFFIHSEVFSFLKANCKKEGLLFGVGGIVQDIRKAMAKRNKIGVEKLILIVPDGYFQYHGYKNALGVVLRNVRKYKFFGFRFGSVPAHHIAFIKENHKLRKMENTRNYILNCSKILLYNKIITGGKYEKSSSYEFMKEFNTEFKCLEFLKRNIWKNGVK